MKKFLTDFLWQALNHLGGRLAVFLLLLYYARLLPVDSYGLLQVLLTLQGMAMVLLDGGTNTLTIKDTALRSAVPKELIKRRTLWFSGVLVLMLPASLAFSSFINPADWLLVAASAACLSVVNFFAFTSRGLHQAKWEGLISLVQKFGAVGIALLLALQIGPQPHWVLTGNIASSIAAVLLALFLWKRAAVPLSPEKVTFGWSSALWLTCVDLGAWTYFRVDVIILKEWAGMTQTGMYGAAYNLFIGLALASNAVMAVIFPRIAAAPTPRDRYVWIMRGFLLLSLGAALLVALLVPASTSLIHLIYGPAYQGAGLLFAILVLATLFMFPNNLLNYLVILAGKEKQYALIVLAATLFNVGANLVAIPHWQATGAAVVTGLTEMLLFTGTATIVALNWKEILHAHRH